MQKVVDFLEKYCQWVAVVIAGLFFLFALWQFLPGVSTPVSVPIGGEVLGPGAVDATILETKATPLANKIAENNKIIDTVPQYGANFVKQLAEKPRTTPVPPAIIAVRPVEVPPSLKPDPSKINDPGAQPQNNLAEMPALPAPTLEVPTTGFAQVTGVGGAAAAAPVQPVIAQPGAAPAPAVPKSDVTWVRVPFSVPMQLVGIAFQRANIPGPFQQTGVVRVELIRQRQLSGDDWAPEEVVKAFDAVVPLQPMPPAGSPPPVMLNYKNWAFANQQPILQPPFYAVVGGEDPNVTKPPEVVAPNVFDPAAFPQNGDISKLPADQQTAVRAERVRRSKEKAAERGQARPQPGAGGRGGGSRGRGGAPDEGMMPRLAPTDAGSTDAVQLQYPPRPGGRPPMPGVGVDAGMEDPGMTGMDPGVPVPGQAIVIEAAPQAPFNPVTLGKDLHGVCYDVNARSDSTYRYRVRYSLANPLYQVAGVPMKNPADANQFAIVGEDPNVWTPPIEIAPRTYVFLASQPVAGSQSVRFTIFRWQDGREYRTVQSFGPGDSIGKVENGIDYRTPWTFVEVRRSASTNDVYAVLMNSEGRLRRNVFEVDKENPKQKQLQQQVEQANAAAGIAAGPTGGRAGAAAGAAE